MTSDCDYLEIHLTYDKDDSFFAEVFAMEEEEEQQQEEEEAQPLEVSSKKRKASEELSGELSKHQRHSGYAQIEQKPSVPRPRPSNRPVSRHASPCYKPSSYENCWARQQYKRPPKTLERTYRWQQKPEQRGKGNQHISSRQETRHQSLNSFRQPRASWPTNCHAAPQYGKSRHHWHSHTSSCQLQGHTWGHEAPMAG